MARKMTWRAPYALLVVLSLLTIIFPKCACWIVNSLPRASTHLGVGDARGDYYGESQGSYMIKEFNTFSQLQEIVKLAAEPLPERPDGIVCVAKFTSLSADCQATEAEFERLAQANPATIFLRCFAEYDDAAILLGMADVTTLPTFDIFYQGSRVARIPSNQHVEVLTLLQMYQFQNSQLDLFSEASQQPWGDGTRKDPNRTPRTTARFIPGYDWDSDKGFFDTIGDKMESDFEALYENWVPPMDNDDDKDRR